MFFILGLKSVLIESGTGCFFFHVNRPGPFHGTICKLSIISSRQSGTECLYEKNCLVLAGTGVFSCNGPKNVPAKFFPYKWNGTNKIYV